MAGNTYPRRFYAGEDGEDNGLGLFMDDIGGPGCAGCEVGNYLRRQHSNQAGKANICPKLFRKLFGACFTACTPVEAHEDESREDDAGGGRITRGGAGGAGARGGCFTTGGEGGQGGDAGFYGIGGTGGAGGRGGFLAPGGKGGRGGDGFIVGDGDHGGEGWRSADGRLCAPGGAGGSGGVGAGGSGGLGGFGGLGGEGGRGGDGVFGVPGGKGGKGGDGLVGRKGGRGGDGGFGVQGGAGGSGGAGAGGSGGARGVLAGPAGQVLSFVLTNLKSMDVSSVLSRMLLQDKTMEIRVSYKVYAESL